MPAHAPYAIIAYLCRLPQALPPAPRHEAATQCGAKVLHFTIDSIMMRNIFRFCASSRAFPRIREPLDSLGVDPPLRKLWTTLESTHA
jgi:hypothetical protein